MRRFKHLPSYIYGRTWHMTIDHRSNVPYLGYRGRDKGFFNLQDLPPHTANISSIPYIGGFLCESAVLVATQNHL
jgi:hypothetical protein